MVNRSASLIADALLAGAAKRGFTMSNLKLQKLLYYVQGYHFIKAGEPAFDDAIKAWSHGPVIPSVYHRFKRFSWLDITDVPQMPKLPDRTGIVIDFVLRRLGSLAGTELEDMTHAEPPWMRARHGLPLGTPASPTIETKWIRAHFSGQQVK